MRGSFFLLSTGKGGKNRRRGKNENEKEKRELVFKEDGQGQYLQPSTSDISCYLNIWLFSWLQLRVVIEKYVSYLSMKCIAPQAGASYEYHNRFLCRSKKKVICFRLEK